MGSRECGATGTRVPRCRGHNAPSNRRRILCLLHKLKLVIKRKPMIDHEHTTLHHKVLSISARKGVLEKAWRETDFENLRCTHNDKSVTLLRIEAESP